MMNWMAEILLPSNRRGRNALDQRRPTALHLRTGTTKKRPPPSAPGQMEQAQTHAGGSDARYRNLPPF